jgi:hypothetical protein
MRVVVRISASSRPDGSGLGFRFRRCARFRVGSVCIRSRKARRISVS